MPMEHIPALVAILGVRPRDQTEDQVAKEERMLEAVAVACSQRYDFSGEGEALRGLFRCLLEKRLLSPDWDDAVPPDQKLRVLQCIRLMVRDPSLQALFLQLGGLDVLAGVFNELSLLHFEPDPPPFSGELLVECASIVKKLVADESCWPLLIRARVHETLVRLLRTTDASLLPSAIVALIGLAREAEYADLIGQLDSIEMLLVMLEQYGAPFNGLAADLLHRMTRHAGNRHQLLQLNGLPKVYGLLSSEDDALLHSLLRIVCSMARDTAAVAESRQIGGVPVLVSLLSPEQGGGSPTGLEGGGGTGGGRRAVPGPALTRLVCSALTRLSTDDEVSHQIRQSNGVYLLGRILMSAPQEGGGSGAGAGAPAGSAAAAAGAARPRMSDPDNGAGAAAAAAAGSGGSVHAYALRSLRFVFSSERNRKVFKRLFPPELFVAFIDVGHYVHDIAPYEVLAAQLASVGTRSREAMAAALEDINVFKDTALKTVRGYQLLELLGKGAFGSVFKGRRGPRPAGDGPLYAIKELPLDDVGLFGATVEEQARGASQVVGEVDILASLDHPNIIQYFESFQEGSSLYIVMELVDGVTLLDYITSLREKGRSMPESQVWRVFVQMMLALHYIHVEKGIVHRDFTPANIMLGHNDRVVKVADFGLAKEKKGGGGVMQSAVGTITYSCPEIVQHEQYTDKADVWSLGCVLYHLLTLRSPFGGSNPLTVASKIVEGHYEPIPEGSYSPEMIKLVTSLLSVSPDTRPTITEVGALVSPVLVAELGRLQKDNVSALQQLAFERERRQFEAIVAFRNEAALRSLLAAGGKQAGGGGDGGGGGAGGGEAMEAALAAAGGRLESARSLAVGEAAGGLNNTGGSVSSASSTDGGGSSSLGGSRGAGGLGGAGAAGSGRPEITPLDLPTPGRGAGGGGGGSLMGSTLGRTGGDQTNRGGGRGATSSKISIAHSRLRPIVDPVAQILGQLHKVMYLAELPPGLERDPRRSCVERFKRHLFAPHQSAGNIKSELAKLLAGSHELVEAELAPPPLAPGRRAPAAGSEHPPSQSPRMAFYELQGVIEDMLQEKGYYDRGK